MPRLRDRLEQEEAEATERARRRLAWEPLVPGLLLPEPEPQDLIGEWSERRRAAGRKR